MYLVSTVRDRRSSRHHRLPGALVLGLVAGTALAASFATQASATPITSRLGGLQVVAAENGYGNVAEQVGGRYVRVRSIESNPTTDPHSYEVSTGVAREVSDARLVIQNGVGYDSFMSKVESASPNARRLVINVAHLLGLPNRTRNPHLWYKPTTMPKVANALASDLARIDPAHRSYFEANARRFIQSLNPWLASIAHLKASYLGAPVAVTEPVADYLLAAAGLHNLTPWALQADIMNGVDPSPQDLSLEQRLLARHQVKVLVFNRQVTDPLTDSLVTDARRAGIPVVGVYETMPAPGFRYQSWMRAEVDALHRALADKASTERL